MFITYLFVCKIVGQIFNGLTFSDKDIAYLRNTCGVDEKFVEKSIRDGLVDIRDDFDENAKVEGVEMKKVIGVMCVLGLLNRSTYSPISKLDLIHIIINSDRPTLKHSPYFDTAKFRMRFLSLLSDRLNPDNPPSNLQTFDSTEWFKNDDYALFLKNSNRSAPLLQYVDESRSNFLMAPLMFKHYLFPSTTEGSGGVIDVRTFVLRRLRGDVLWAYLSEDQGSAEMLLVDILGPYAVYDFLSYEKMKNDLDSSFFERYGPVMLCDFSSFKEFGSQLSYLSEYSEGHLFNNHAMLLVGVRKGTRKNENGNENIYLLQNWFASAQLLEVSSDFLFSRGLRFMFVTGFRKNEETKKMCESLSNSECVNYSECILSTNTSSWNTLSCVENPCSGFNAEVDCVGSSECSWNEDMKACGCLSLETVSFRVVSSINDKTDVKNKRTPKNNAVGMVQTTVHVKNTEL